MGICKYCGKDAGWFKDAHTECTELVETGCQGIADAVKQAVSHGAPFAETKAALDRATFFDHVPADRAHQAILQAWSQAAEETALAEPLSVERYAAMLQFARDAGLDQAELAGYSGSITASVSAVLWRAMNGDMKDIPTVAHPFNLVGNEVALLNIDGVIYGKDTVVRTYHTDYSGTSFKFGYGTYYHFGSSDRTEVDHTTLLEADRGQVLFTTNNVYFGGAHRSVRIAYEHIVQFRFFSNGLGFTRDAPNAMLEVFQVMQPWSPACGRLMFNLATFLGQPAARQLYGNPGKHAAGSRS